MKHANSNYDEFCVCVCWFVYFILVTMRQLCISFICQKLFHLCRKLWNYKQFHFFLLHSMSFDASQPKLSIISKFKHCICFRRYFSFWFLSFCGDFLTTWKKASIFKMHLWFYWHISMHAIFHKQNDIELSFGCFLVFHEFRTQTEKNTSVCSLLFLKFDI